MSWFVGGWLVYAVKYVELGGVAKYCIERGELVDYVDYVGMTKYYTGSWFVYD